MDDTIKDAVSIDERAIAAKQHENEMECLMEDFMHFLHARVAKYSTQISNEQREEMLNTAMLAFYESIQRYDITKGHFFSFAYFVVTERIIDYIRKVYRHSKRTVSLDADNDIPLSAQSKVIAELSIRSFEAARKQELLAEEIEQFTAELSTWGITMADLIRESPKHKKLLERYKVAVQKISQDPDIMQTIQIKRYFPVKAISKITGLPQKNLERARTFILASLIIKTGDYDYMSDYVRWEKR